MEKKSYVIAGTYTKDKSKGIYLYGFDPEKGTIAPVSICPVANPSFITWGGNGGRLYSVTENESGNSYANAFLFDRTGGEMQRLNRRVTNGEGSCHIAIDNQQRFIVTANYGGGSISVFPIEKDGRIAPLSQYITFSGTSKHPERQEAPHPHCSAFSPDGKYLFVTDLGTDTIYRFDVDDAPGNSFVNEDSRKDFRVKAGTGPRHLVFGANGRCIYVITELRGTILVYAYNNGDLTLVEETSICDKPQEGGGAVALSADGKYLFASMREGNDGIAVFKTETNGRLSRRGYYNVSEHPRDIIVSPDSKYLLIAAMNDNRIEVLQITSRKALKETGHSTDINMPAFVGFL